MSSLFQAHDKGHMEDTVKMLSSTSTLMMLPMTRMGTTDGTLWGYWRRDNTEP
mgnify:FL=1